MFINQLQVFALLAYYMLEIRGESGAIVRTLSTTSMLDVMGKKYGVDVYETGVGMKYVSPKMLETDAMLGGEESGGFAFKGLPERDGLMVPMALLDLMLETGHTPSELIQDIYDTVGAVWHYDRVDVRFRGRGTPGHHRPFGRGPTFFVGRARGDAHRPDRWVQVLFPGQRMVAGAILRHGASDAGLRRIDARRQGEGAAGRRARALGRGRVVGQTRIRWGGQRHDLGPRQARGDAQAGWSLVDTHCHLDARQFADDSVAAVLDRAHDAGVSRVVTIGIDLSLQPECRVAGRGP